MKKNKIKKLLHNQRKVKAENDLKEGKKNDNHLHLRFASEDDIKAEGQRSALNRIRRLNVRSELNQYEHSDSKHIRLKPYYNAHLPIHWTGVVSDITTPHKAEQPEGSILIDKITTEDHEELIDYHLWLNITSIKMLKNTNTQKISVGDYIEGISYVTPYRKTKYGLGATIILNCGIYVGKNKPEKIISNYDRGDDWVLTMTNSTAGEKNREEFDKGDYDIKTIDEMAGHVTCSYQPSRYTKFQMRLISDDEVSQEKPLPLVSETMEKYTTVVKNVYANRFINNDEYEYVPALGTGIIYNSHNRVIAPYANLAYPKQLAQSYGLIPKDTEIEFTASKGEGANQLFKINKIEPVKPINQDEFVKIPTDKDALAGYLLFNQNKEGDMKTPAGKEAIDAFLEWSDEEGIDIIATKYDQATDWKDTEAYYADEVANYLRISPTWIGNLVKQRMLVPINEDDASQISDMRFMGTEITKLHQVMTANDEVLAKAIIQRYHFYRACDMAKMLGIPEMTVVSIIVKTNNKSLNKFYGRDVFELVKDYVETANKAREENKSKVEENKKQELLNRYASNPSGVLVKRTIPKDKSVSTMQKTEPVKTEETHTESPFFKEFREVVDNGNKRAEAMKKKDKKLSSEQLSLLGTEQAKDEKTVPVVNKMLEVHKTEDQNTALPNIGNMLDKWKKDSHIIFKDSKTAHRFSAQDNKIINKPANKNQLHVRVVFSTFDGNYYTDQFADKDEAVRFFESPLKPNELNRFLNGINTENKMQKAISVRHVMEWTFKD